MAFRQRSCLLGLLFSISGALAGAPEPAGSPEFFESRIRPILANNCYGCHTNSKLGGLRVDSREAMLAGGSSGSAIVRGDPEKSLLIKAVVQSGDLKMPKGGKLKKEEIGDLIAWVKAGAEWPAAAKPAVTPGKSGEYAITHVTARPHGQIDCVEAGVTQSFTNSSYFSSGRCLVITLPPAVK